VIKVSHTSMKKEKEKPSFDPSTSARPETWCFHSSLIKLSISSLDLSPNRQHVLDYSYALALVKLHAAMKNFILDKGVEFREIYLGGAENITSVILSRLLLSQIATVLQFFIFLTLDLYTRIKWIQGKKRKKCRENRSWKEWPAQGICL
jgi:hypothetical protein